jgi:hypothetical protein
MQLFKVINTPTEMTALEDLFLAGCCVVMGARDGKYELFFGSLCGG